MISDFYIVVGLQVLIILLVVVDYFLNKRKIKKLRSEIERIDNKIKTFGCVSEQTSSGTIRRKNGFIKKADKV